MRSPCCLSMYLPPPNVARQRLGKHLPAATNTHATVEELFDVVFYMPYRIRYSICTERKVGD
jgi:hypothetical protein